MVATTVRDVRGQHFVTMYAEHLKRQGKMEIPPWVDIVKTATFKELAPTNPDWYYIRAAAIARQVYLRPNTGVGTLTSYFGGKAGRGVAPGRFQKSNRGLIRNILQQLENIGVLKVVGNGRVVTKKGQQDLDRIAGNVRQKFEEEDEEDSSESEEESDESESDEDSD